jgi:hypothetical protein
MKLRFEEMSNVKGLPDSYVLIAVYPGTSAFPLACFFVLKVWWERFRSEPEIVFGSASEGATSGDVESAETATRLLKAANPQLYRGHLDGAKP